MNTPKNVEPLRTPVRQIIKNEASPESGEGFLGKSNLVFGRNKDMVHDWMEVLQAKGSPASGLAFSTPGTWSGSPLRFMSSPLTPGEGLRKGDDGCAYEGRGRTRHADPGCEGSPVPCSEFVDVEKMPAADLSEQQMMLKMVRQSTSQRTDRQEVDVTMSQPRMQRENIKGEKGLENPSGHNNCFLNVILQALFHLDDFRESFLDEEPIHTCTDQTAPDTCLYCAVHNLFTQYRFSEHRQLPPYLIRQILHNMFNSEGRFQLGDMEDVCECLEAVLFRLHLTANDKLDYCSPPCFVHTTFSLNIMEKHECHTRTCSKLYEPTFYTATVQYFPSALFINCPQTNHKKCTSLESCMRWHLRGVPRTCSGCSNPAPLHSYLLGTPKHFSLGIAWDRNSAHESVPKSDIEAFASRIPETLNLSDIYLIPGYLPTRPREEETGKVLSYSLSSVIVYYGLHYTCYCLNAGHEWIYFDDARVTKVGTAADLRAKIVSSRQQPVLLLYTLLPEGTVKKRKVTPANPKDAKSKRDSKTDCELM